MIDILYGPEEKKEKEMLSAISWPIFREQFPKE